MIRDSVGNLYGTAQHGEVSGAGSVFKLTPDGHLHTLYQFKNGADGGYPLSSLVLDAEGNFWNGFFRGKPQLLFRGGLRRRFQN